VSITAPRGAVSWWDTARALSSQLDAFEAGASGFSSDTAHCRPMFGIYKYNGLPCDQVATLIKADIWNQAKAGLAALASAGVPRTNDTGYSLGRTRQRYYNTIRLLIEVMVRASNVCFVISGSAIGETITDYGCMLPKPDGGHTGGAACKAVAARMLPNCDVEFRGERMYTADDYRDGYVGPTKGRPFGYQGAAPFALPADLEGSTGTNPGSIDSFVSSINENTSVIGTRYWRQLKGPVDSTPANGTIISPYFNLYNTASDNLTTPTGSTGVRYVVLQSEVDAIPAVVVAGPVQDTTSCGGRTDLETYNTRIAPIAAMLNGTPLPDTWGLDGITPLVYYRYAPCPNDMSKRAWFKGTIMSGEAICAYAQALAQDWSQLDLFTMFTGSLANYLAYIQNFVDAGYGGMTTADVEKMHEALRKAQIVKGQAEAASYESTATAAASVAGVVVGILAAIGQVIGQFVVPLTDALYNISLEYICPGPFQIRISDQAGCAQIDPNAPGGASQGADILKAVFTPPATPPGRTPPPQTSSSTWIIGGVGAAAVALLGILFFKRK